jgi:hypothetical protein
MEIYFIHIHKFTNNTTAGFVRAIQGVSNNNGWDHLYQISYFYGFMTSLTVYYLLYVIFPQEKQRGSSPFVLEMHVEMLSGVDALSEEGTGEVAKGGEKTNVESKC